ncbi:MAG: alpha/beta-type small acid-soluble spore protein [Firmicutes bacterium]|jgi:hypothetical protein|nr:alpha/beta-type small acid-soluble spore protein [Bacillota bacterium]
MMAKAKVAAGLARRRTLNRLKYEVAKDLGLDDDIRDRGFVEMTTSEVGQIGGNMVKRLVAQGEDAMAAKESPESDPS